MAYTEVAAASSSNVNISAPGFTDLDGVTLTVNVSRILLTGQTTPSQNGVWVFKGSGAALARPPAGDQFATGNVFDNATVVWVPAGAVHGGTVWGIEAAAVVEIDAQDLKLAHVNLPRADARYATIADISLATPPPWVDGRTVADGKMGPSLPATTRLRCSTSRPFTPADVGKSIIVEGAGVAAADLVTTIAAYISPFDVTLTTGYSTQVEDAVVRYGVPLVGDGAEGSDVVLVKDQAVRTENGLYWANTGGAMQRTREPLIPGRSVLVLEGHRNPYTRYELANRGVIELGVTELNFAPQNLVFNVRDFGAFGDGVADDLPAFKAALASMDGVSLNAGGVLEVPPGTYRLGGNLHITRACTVRGSSVGSGSGSTTLFFDAPYGLVVDRFNTGPTGGAGDWSTIENLDIRSTRYEEHEFSIWAESTAVTTGQIVYAPGDNRYIFKCVTPGTTGTTNPFDDSPTLTMDSIINDGPTVQWLVQTHSGIILKARALVRKVHLQFFNNAGVFIAAAYGSEDPPANANEWQLSHLYIANCGLGVSVYGGDANVGTAIDVSVDTIGKGIAGEGGHGFWDEGNFGSTYVGCHVSDVTGHAYLAPTTLNCSAFLGCYTEPEGTTKPPKIGYTGVLIGGGHGTLIDNDSRGLILVPGQSRNIHFNNEQTKTSGGLDHFSGPEVMWFQSTDDGGGTRRYSTIYEALQPGEWSFMVANRGIFSYLGASTDSPGTWRDPRGHYLGQYSAEDMFIGPKSAMKDVGVRGGFYKIGDQFWLQGTETAPREHGGRAGTFAGWTVRRAGYRGYHWTLNSAYTAGDPANGSPANMVEPTANDPNEPAANGDVFRCVKDGTSGATEPAWVTTTIGAITNDNDVEWEYVGKVALYNRIGPIAREDRLVTTDDTPTTIATYEIDDDVVTYLDIYVVAIDKVGHEAATFRLSGSWFGSGGTAMQVRPPSQDQKDPALTTWNANLLAAVGNTVSLEVTGAAATTINWTVVQKGAEGT